MLSFIGVSCMLIMSMFLLCAIFAACIRFVTLLSMLREIMAAILSCVCVMSQAVIGLLFVLGLLECVRAQSVF